MKCRICNNKTNKAFSAKILNKYNINYYFCNKCGSLQTDEPYWLEEAYNSPINFSDTGLVQRNIYLSKKLTVLLYFLFGVKGKYLDYAGGYGLFTRLMRDIGFDFYWYDPYTPNLMAKGFEYNEKDPIEAITTFETFEHFVNPINEIEKMLNVSKNIIFTTDLLPNPIPKPLEWSYYGLEHGQHIIFYSLKTLRFIAQKYGLALLSNGKIHIFTSKQINEKIYSVILKSSKFSLLFISKTLKTRTLDDMFFLIDRNK